MCYSNFKKSQNVIYNVIWYFEWKNSHEQKWKKVYNSNTLIQVRVTWRTSQSGGITATITWSSVSAKQMNLWWITLLQCARSLRRSLRSGIWMFFLRIVQAGQHRRSRRRSLKAWPKVKYGHGLHFCPWVMVLNTGQKSITLWCHSEFDLWTLDYEISPPWLPVQCVWEVLS